MAQFTLDSKDMMSCLISLAKRLPDAIAWVGQHPQKMKIEVPDDLWNRAEGDQIPRKIGYPCFRQGVTEERTETEILLGVLAKMASQRHAA